MALNLASPGILIREVDLTIGRIDGTTGKVGGIVGSFEKDMSANQLLLQEKMTCLTSLVNHTTQISNTKHGW